MRILILILLLAVPVSLFAQTESQPEGAIAVEDSATQDAAMAVRIRDILAELDGYEDVTVSVTSGIVTLRGTTLDSEKISRLNDLTGRFEGVVAIKNNVTETTDVVKRLNPAVERFRARLAQVIAFVPLASVALLAFVIIVVFGFSLRDCVNLGAGSLQMRSLLISIANFCGLGLSLVVWLSRLIL